MSPAPVILKGITWNHTRGYVPMVATAQRFSEIHPGIEVQWSKRSLLDFGEISVETLALRFDLLVIDHPSIGFAAESSLFHPLDELLDSAFLLHQEDSAGPSHRSYQWKGRQWALAIDAACPVAHWRQDLLDEHRIPVPRTWEEVLALTKEGKVMAPFIHTDALHHFFMFCHALGAEPFASEQSWIDPEVAQAALEECRKLAQVLPKECLAMNPILTLEALARGDAWYCPAAFGYSNYSRPGYASRLITSGETVSRDSLPLKTTLGGAGLAISASCKHPEWASRYAAFTASPDTQRGIYFSSGGQPAHRSAWVDPEVNGASANFFSSTLPTIQNSWLRPRYNGYMHFQDHSAHIVHQVTCGDLSSAEGLAQLDSLYRRSLGGAVG